MSDLKTRIAAQFGGADTREIEVPEWGEGATPLIVHYRRANLRDISEATQLAKGDQFLANAYLVTAKALDAAGKPLFKRVDAGFLAESADPAVVGRIAQAITGGDVLSAEAIKAAEGN